MTKKLRLFRVVEMDEYTDRLIWARSWEEALEIFKENLLENIYFKSPKYTIYSIMKPKRGVAEQFLEREKMS